MWIFGHDCGLTEEVVPARSRQDEEREWCREVIGGMDFGALRGRASYREDLRFPEWGERLR